MTGKAGITAVAVAAALALTGCHFDRSSTAQPRGTNNAVTFPPGALRLVAFNSCADVIAGLNRAASDIVGPYGLPGGGMDLREGVMKAADGAAPMPDAGPIPTTPDHSQTNVQEAGVDEPDMVKTDGQRILTVTRGVLHVIDATTHVQTGSVDLIQAGLRINQIYYGDAQILLFGDRALVINQSPVLAYMRGPESSSPKTDSVIKGPRITLVDLAGTPSILATYDIDGGYVDARQVGSTVRVVVRSSPRVMFPYRQNATDAQRTAENRKVIAKLGVNDWLPRYTVTEGGTTSSGHVPCDHVQRPDVFSAASMLSVLSFDLSKAALGNGDATTIVANGDTVYGTASSLYIASDQRWRAYPIGGPVRLDDSGVIPPDSAQSSESGSTGAAPKPQTEIYRFDISQPGTPRFVGAGKVPGFLVNSYAMSEWDGHLRVAVTSGFPWEGFNAARQDSSVYVLSTDRAVLRIVGHVGGLGHQQRIYAVRFAGPVGYVVTFRQVDPLYTIDLSNPALPAVRGELELKGYSAYLHPIDGTHLVGIGQDADANGHVQGTLVSLFDVSDPARPTRTAATVISDSSSSAEFDPHAFLYWPATGSVIVPVATDKQIQRAVEFRVNGNTLTKVGSVMHPTDGQYGAMERSFVIGSTLWTLSTAGLMASDITTLNKLTWVPLPQ